MSLRALGGAKLEGNRLVRVTYMDESGSDPKDPLLAVAAVIIDGDKSLVAVEEYLESLIAKHIPPEHQDGYVFHAVDIYSGGNRKCIFHDKSKWPDARRFAILDDLAELPKKFNLPVCMALIDKNEFPDSEARRGKSPLVVYVAQHATAIAQAAIQVELWMRQKTTGEITHLIAEDNSDVRQAAREMQVMLRDKRRMMGTGSIFPFVRIRDGLQFATKQESKALQIADFCSWACRRAVKDANNARRFYEPIRAQVVRVAADEAATAG